MHQLMNHCGDVLTTITNRNLLSRLSRVAYVCVAARQMHITIQGVVIYGDITFSAYHYTLGPCSRFKSFSPVSTEAQQPKNHAMFWRLASAETMRKVFLAYQVAQILSDFAYFCNVYMIVACHVLFTFMSHLYGLENITFRKQMNTSSLRCKSQRRTINTLVGLFLKAILDMHCTNGSCQTA